MSSYVIVGASRGIGYSLLKNLSFNASNTVIGLVRNVDEAIAKVATELPGCKNVHFVYADLESRDSLVAAVQKVSAISSTVDVFIANAAVGSDVILPLADEARADPAAFDANMLKQFGVNVLGTIHAIALFAPLVEASKQKKILVVSSGLGDLDVTLQTDVAVQGPYSISKAAVNMAVAKLHAEYHARGVLVCAISPGIVATGFGSKPSASLEEVEAFQAAQAKIGARLLAYDPSWSGVPYTPNDAAANVLNVLSNATIEKNGGIMVSHHGNKKWL